MQTECSHPKMKLRLIGDRCWFSFSRDCLQSFRTNCMFYSPALFLTSLNTSYLKAIVIVVFCKSLFYLGGKQESCLVWGQLHSFIHSLKCFSQHLLHGLDKGWQTGALGQSGPLTVLVKKGFLKHDYAYSLIYCLWLFLLHIGRV